MEIPSAQPRTIRIHNVCVVLPGFVPHRTVANFGASKPAAYSDPQRRVTVEQLTFDRQAHGRTREPIVNGYDRAHITLV